MHTWIVPANFWEEVYFMAEQEQSHFPSAVEALRAVLQEDFPDDIEVNRIEIRITGSGHCPYRLFPRDGGDYLGGSATVSDDPF
jgi:hypothetical protein